MEAKNTGKDIRMDLKVYFTFNLNAIKYIDKGAIKNKILPGLIDNENPNIKVINKISTKGILWFLCKELIDLPPNKHQISTNEGTAIASSISNYPSVTLTSHVLFGG